MAARLSPKHDAATREKIKTSQLVNRLQGFTLSEPDATSGKPIQMSGDQVRACIALLKKVIPDLAVTQHTGDSDNPIQTNMTISFRSPPK